MPTAPASSLSHMPVSSTFENLMASSSAISSVLPLAMSIGSGSDSGPSNKFRARDVLTVIKGIAIADLTTKLIPAGLAALGSYLAARRKRRLMQREQRAQLEAASRDGNGVRREKMASIILHRNYAPGDNQASASQNDTYDALIWRLCQVPQTRFLKLAANGVYVICNNDVIEYDEDFSVKQISINYDDSNNVLNAIIEVFSYTTDLLGTKKFLELLQEKYHQHLNNQLGQELFYFDNIPYQLQRLMDGDVNYDVLPKQMVFTMSKMRTNKSLENVYGDAMDTVRKRVHFFVNNKKWYAERGIPYTLGLLLHGLPGCGKTSLTKALSRDCRRHIFNVKLNEGTTVSQLHDLFFNDRISVTEGGQTRTYNIPMDQRLIVMEDIDCLSSIVLHRDALAVDQVPRRPTRTTVKSKTTTAAAPHGNMFCPLGDTSMFGLNSQSLLGHDPNHGYPSQAQNHGYPSQAPSHNRVPPHTLLDDDAMSNEQHPQRLTLSILLNVLDGILETPGRILIMTSNHPERLDPALTRPGRIDLKVRFDTCSYSDIVTMMRRLAGFDVSEAELVEAGVPTKRWTAADVTQKIFENIDDRYAALMSLSERPGLAASSSACAPRPSIHDCVLVLDS